MIFTLLRNLSKMLYSCCHCPKLLICVRHSSFPAFVLPLPNMNSIPLLPIKHLPPSLVSFARARAVAPLLLPARCFGFRCWVARRTSPNMAILDLRCDALPWAASYTGGRKGRVFFGFSSGNFLQLLVLQTLRGSALPSTSPPSR